jgi:hypothetical protein
VVGGRGMGGRIIYNPLTKGKKKKKLQYKYE